MYQIEIVGTIRKNMMNYDEESPALNPVCPRRAYLWSQRENWVQKTSFLVKLLLIPMR